MTIHRVAGDVFSIVMTKEEVQQFCQGALLSVARQQPAESVSAARNRTGQKHFFRNVLMNLSKAVGLAKEEMWTH